MEIRQLLLVANLASQLHVLDSVSIIHSELIWALYVVSQNLSYSSCDNIKATLNAMFPGIILETFSLSSSEISFDI